MLTSRASPLPLRGKVVCGLAILPFLTQFVMQLSHDVSTNMRMMIASRPSISSAIVGWRRIISALAVAAIWSEEC